jgi:hypothetical protein
MDKTPVKKGLLLADPMRHGVKCATRIVAGKITRGKLFSG